MCHIQSDVQKIASYRSSPPVFRKVRVAQSSVFYVMFCRLLSVLSSSFLWSLYYLSLFY